MAARYVPCFEELDSKQVSQGSHLKYQHQYFFVLLFLLFWVLPELLDEG